MWDWQKLDSQNKPLLVPQKIMSLLKWKIQPFIVVWGFKCIVFFHRTNLKSQKSLSKPWRQTYVLLSECAVKYHLQHVLVFCLDPLHTAPKKVWFLLYQGPRCGEGPAAHSSCVSAEHWAETVWESPAGLCSVTPAISECAVTPDPFKPFSAFLVLGSCTSFLPNCSEF